MKKRKISFMIVSIVILTMGIGGCSKEKTVIVDTNVQDSKNTGVNISEETINVSLVREMPCSRISICTVSNTKSIYRDSLRTYARICLV